MVNMEIKRISQAAHITYTYIKTLTGFQLYYLDVVRLKDMPRADVCCSGYNSSKIRSFL